MKYATATAFRQALDDRLKTEHRETELPLARLRKRVAFELFLRRLVEVAPGRWVLKGALALDFRLDAPTRSTKDIDLGRDDDERSAIADVTAAQHIELDDFFSFEAELDEGFALADDASAIRFRVRAVLAGSVFERFVLDIGLTDTISWIPDTITTSDFLTFAGIEPIAIPVIPIPQHIAEKVHAYTRTYGEDHRPSSRPKDLVDILLIASREPVVAEPLHEALERTFAARADQDLPITLPPPPTTWTKHFEKMAAEVGVESDLTQAHRLATAFLDPILAGRTTGRWNAAARAWVE